jgi:hypothetical protein
MLLTVPASAQPAPQTGKSGKQALKEEKKAQHLCQKHANWNINDCRQIAQVCWLSLKWRRGAFR